MNTTITFTQLIGQLPTILVYLGGIIAAAMFWPRAHLPAILTMAAMLLMLATTIAFSVLQSYFIQNTSRTQLSQNLMFLGIASSVIRAGSMAILVTAVFIGRRRETSGFEIPLATPASNHVT